MTISHVPHAMAKPSSTVLCHQLQLLKWSAQQISSVPCHLRLQVIASLYLVYTLHTSQYKVFGFRHLVKKFFRWQKQCSACDMSLWSPHATTCGSFTFVVVPQGKGSRFRNLGSRSCMLSTHSWLVVLLWAVWIWCIFQAAAKLANLWLQIGRNTVQSKAMYIVIWLEFASIFHVIKLYAWRLSDLSVDISPQTFNSVVMRSDPHKRFIRIPTSKFSPL